MSAFVRERPDPVPGAPEGGWQALCDDPCGEFWQIRSDPSDAERDAAAHNERLHGGEKVKVLDALGQEWFVYEGEA